MDLEGKSLKELSEIKKEIEKRERDIKENERQKRIKENENHINFLIDHKELILQLIDHSRTSCSDKFPSNGYSTEYGARCTKCHLMEILNGEWGNLFEVDFNVTITEIE